MSSFPSLGGGGDQLCSAQGAAECATAAAASFASVAASLPTLSAGAAVAAAHQLLPSTHVPLVTFTRISHEDLKRRGRAVTQCARKG